MDESGLAWYERLVDEEKEAKSFYIKTWEGILDSDEIDEHLKSVMQTKKEIMKQLEKIKKMNKKPYSTRYYNL
jgi:molecular chaperone DnaK (HSP70)